MGELNSLFKIIICFLLNIIQTASTSVVPGRKGDKHQNVLFISVQGILPSLIQNTSNVSSMGTGVTLLLLWKMEWKVSNELQNTIG